MFRNETHTNPELRLKPRKTTGVRYQIFQAYSSWQHVIAPGSGWIPPVDVYETTTEFVVEMCLAGIDPERVQIQFEGESIRITGQRPEETTPDLIGYHIMEIERGNFMRLIELPAPVDPRTAQAESQQGVLTLRVEKRSGGRTPGCYSADSMEGFE